MKEILREREVKMSAIESIIGTVLQDPVSVAARTELAQLRARIEELEKEFDAKHAKLVEVADKLIIQRNCARVSDELIAALKARIEELEGELAQFTACKALDKPHDPSDPSVVILTIHRGGPIGGGPKDNGGT